MLRRAAASINRFMSKGVTPLINTFMVVIDLVGFAALRFAISGFASQCIAVPCSFSGN